MSSTKLIKQAIIYRIFSPSANTQYIGSTTKDLKTRFSIHKSQHKRLVGGIGKVKCSSFIILEFPDAQIESLEVLNDCSKADMLQREKEHINIDKFNCVNLNNPFQTPEEKKEQHFNLCKDYRAKNVDIANKRAKELINCECGKSYTYSNRTNHIKTKKHINYYLNNH